MYIFFFSSRRRHTILVSDWSSDVCSSDLFRYGGRMLLDGGLVNPVPIAPTLNDTTELTVAVNLNGPIESRPPSLKRDRKSVVRERVYIDVVAVVYEDNRMVEMS